MIGQTQKRQRRPLIDLHGDRFVHYGRFNFLRAAFRIGLVGSLIFGLRGLFHAGYLARDIILGHYVYGLKGVDLREIGRLGYLRARIGIGNARKYRRFFAGGYLAAAGDEIELLTVCGMRAADNKLVFVGLGLGVPALFPPLFNGFGKGTAPVAAYHKLGGSFGLAAVFRPAQPAAAPAFIAAVANGFVYDARLAHILHRIDLRDHLSARAADRDLGRKQQTYERRGDEYDYCPRTGDKVRKQIIRHGGEETAAGSCATQLIGTGDIILEVVIRGMAYSEVYHTAYAEQRKETERHGARAELAVGHCDYEHPGDNEQGRQYELHHAEQTEQYIDGLFERRAGLRIGEYAHDEPDCDKDYAHDLIRAVELRLYLLLGQGAGLPRGALCARGLAFSGAASACRAP